MQLCGAIGAGLGAGLVAFGVSQTEYHCSAVGTYRRLRFSPLGGYIERFWHRYSWAQRFLLEVSYAKSTAGRGSYSIATIWKCSERPLYTSGL
jgi:hypothetical protein